MDIIILIGRILFALIFVAGGIGHLTATTDMTQIVQSKGIPAARAVVLSTGVLLVTASLMLILGLWADVAALALFCFLVPTAIFIHNFWTEKDPQVRLMEQLHFNKDLSLAGAALLLLGFLLLTGEDVGLFITDPLLPRLAG
ncbi:DoxX family protein [Nocardioides sp. NPDC006273]|uniref:DoxX family protein n=1 Tax=Nocardioides sp. NPDC006273 TaxID=3155598 RepID=UPI0033A3BF42